LELCHAEGCVVGRPMPRDCDHLLHCVGPG
jgi:hypothetical protein